MKKKLANLLITVLIISLINTGLIGFLVYDKLTGNTAVGVSFNKTKPVVISRDYDKGQSMEKAKATGKPIIVWFYTDWCGYCQRFAPTFKKLTNLRSIKRKYAVAYVNAEKQSNSALVKEYEIKGYPTVYIVNGIKKELIPNSLLFDEDALEVLKEILLQER